ncbi:MAG: zeta toxin family protein [Akkermansiaceae bacterium]|nr:zeta toxin family protein [Akkermansiaceae bacterium]MCF7732504.1 zeta toxin family protein [Akkermansiaceae bacterium]
MKPRLLMLAGPNGAGKSTFFTTHLADKGLPFINADRIAAELELGAYEAAGIAESIRVRMVNEGRSFITETVLSDPVGAKVAFLQQAHATGYDITLIFIGLESTELSAGRVMARVQKGGHDVPSDKIMARFERTLLNLERAIDLLPQVIVYDNSSAQAPYRFLAEFRSGRLHQRTKGPVPQWAERCFERDRG